MLPAKSQKTGKTRRSTLVILTISFILATAICFVVLEVKEGREVKFNNASSSRMHGLAYMLRAYYNFRGHLPPPVTYNEEGQAMHSWRTIMLRDYSSEDLSGYDFSLPWNSPANLEFARNNVPEMVQYMSDARGPAPNFMLAIGEGCLYPSRDAKPEQFFPPGSTEPVLILVESSRDDVLWTEPVDVEGVTEANPFVRPEDSVKHRKRARVLYYIPKSGKFQSGTEGEFNEQHEPEEADTESNPPQKVHKTQTTDPPAGT